MSRTVLILGAASDMARAIARAFASDGYGIQLAARSPERLEEDRADLVTRYGIEVTLHAFDAVDFLVRRNGFKAESGGLLLAHARHLSRTMLKRYG